MATPSVASHSGLTCSLSWSPFRIWTVS